MTLFKLLAALSAGCVAVLLATRRQNNVDITSISKYPVSFESVAPGLLRQGFLWALPSRSVDVHVFLVQIGKSYVLVDVGAPPGQSYEKILIEGLREALKDGDLRLVILTHGHIDHVGALNDLVKYYSDVQVVIHAEEAPYLIGGKRYEDIPADNPNYSVSTFDVSKALPPSRVLLVTGETGDVADAMGPSGQKPAWVPPQGILKYLHSPGHSPGQVAYLHRPSKSIIAGDVFTNMGKIAPATPQYTPNNTLAHISLQKLRDVDFDQAYCAHDSATGVSKLALQRFLDTLTTIKSTH